MRFSDAFNKKAQTAPADMASDAGVDISDATDSTPSEAPYRNQVPEKKKKKKKESILEIVNAIKEIKSRFLGETQLKPLNPNDLKNQLKPIADAHNWKDSKQILKTLDEIEESLSVIASLNDPVTLLNRYIYAVNTHEALNQAQQKFAEIKEILQTAEYQETDNTARSILLDLMRKVDQLNQAIPEHLIS